MPHNPDTPTIDGRPMPFVTRKDSQGRIHRTYYNPADGGPDAKELFGQDSVQVTCDGKFRIGDRARPTKEYIRECCHGSVPLELVENWAKGFRITEIGPEGFPYKGFHAVELEGADMLFLDTSHIEKVV